MRETYGALVAHHQAATAGDRAIARTMHAIAEDETRHAGLAWDVAAWLEPQLTAALASEPAPALRQLAGIPAAAQAVTMLDALTETFLAA